jgi:hypothetical protein
MWYSETLGVIKTPKEVTIGGSTYPRQIFRKWGKPELAELGIKPARVEYVDRRYYTTGRENYELVGEEWVISYDTTEKSVESLKKQLVADIKANVSAVLSPSDWRVIREADGGTAVSDEWKTWRNETRQHGNALESGVEAFASVDAVRNFQNHQVVEVRYRSTHDDGGNETIGPDTYESDRIVDKTTWGWPVSPDAEIDPYHVEYK